MKIQLTITQLESIISKAAIAKANESSLSNTIEIEVIKSTDSLLGGDCINATLKSSYAECNGMVIY